MKQRLWELAPATAQKNINLRTLDAILIPLPPLQEQRRIVAEAEKLFSLAQSVETIALATLSRSKQLRGSLLSTVIHRPSAVFE
jgi:type I restriction enzyme S subunit